MKASEKYSGVEKPTSRKKTQNGVDCQLNIYYLCTDHQSTIMKETFGNLLKQLRREKNISQRGLAEKIGVDFSYISKVENDRLPPPSADTIIKIAEVLKVPAEGLLSQSKKLPSDIKVMVGSSVEALKFMNAARDMKLSNEEWNILTEGLKKLR